MGKRVLLLVALAMALTMLATTVYAQGASTESKERRAVKETISWFDTIMQGGVIGFVIIGLSIAALALAIEHFMTIKRDQLVPPELLGHLESLFEDEEYEEAMTLCESAPNFLTNVIAAGLPKIGQPYEQIEASMQEAGEQEAVKLHQKISYLSLIGNISPMLGLFGTVTGMIVAFNVIAKSQGAPSPADLAGGIQVALVTTFLGLLVAIPAVAAYFYFRNKVIRIVMEVGTIAEELMERFRPTEEVAP
jgi:biopolymer transport protein ExbB